MVRVRASEPEGNNPPPRMPLNLEHVLPWRPDLSRCPETWPHSLSKIFGAWSRFRENESLKSWTKTMVVRATYTPEEMRDRERRGCLSE